MRLVWELSEGPTTEIKLTFWTSPPSMFDRVRERGRERWWRRRLGKALRRMRELLESGAEAPRTGVAGEDRVPTTAG